MYKEPFATEEVNKGMDLRVEEKITEVASKVADPEQSDADFADNLYDLCVLNRMQESHDKGTHGH